MSPVSHKRALHLWNSKKVENIWTNQLHNRRISRDSLYNLHKPAIDIPDFIHANRTHSDLVCICGQRASFQELNRVLHYMYFYNHPLLSYDTCTKFHLGDTHVSVLLFRHTLFKVGQLIQAEVMLDQRKFQFSHSELHVLTLCIKAIPFLKGTKHHIVLDNEKGTVNTITTNMLWAILLRCWNHLLQDVTKWLHNHDA